MKAVTSLTTLILAGALLGPGLVQAQVRAQPQPEASSSFTIQNLEATASSVRFRVGTGEAATYIDTGTITIRGSGHGTFDRARTNARVTWDVTADAPGLRARGIGPLTLMFVGVAVYDRERGELFVVDAAGMGGGTAAQGQTCSQCVQNINIASKPKDSDQAVDWGRGIGGPVEFRSLSAEDLDRHPVADMIVQASQAAGLGLARRDLEIMTRQYRQESSKELVVYYPETGEAFSFDLEGRATIEFGGVEHTDSWREQN
jgi:hypothetical protein